MDQALPVEDSPLSPVPKTDFTSRIASIDILRGLTMFLMIFVNDLFTLKDVPDGLEHVKRGVDGMHLADTIYPAFLFIVGLSLPFAIENRRKKGESDWMMAKHVLIRSVSLLIMGSTLFTPEAINIASTGIIPGYVWNSITCIAIILVWNAYPKNSNKNLVYIKQAIGILILILLVFLYKEEKIGSPNYPPQKWGILGGIGWGYLISGLITIFSRNKFYPILAGWVFFCILSMLSKAHMIPRGGIFPYIPGYVIGGTVVGFTIGGVLTSYIFRYYRERKDNFRITVIFLIFSAILFALFAYTRPFWGLAKLGMTPAWLYICSAITILAFLIVYWIADVKQKSSWFNIIKPAGTDTLLCYIVPYFFYDFIISLNLKLPDALITGGIGLLKSILFALLCIWVTYGLNRIGIRLKL
jgi:heparan-alpha-glucosaminide N-acetyltransferase